ncbi:MAG: VTT domain-containing protein [Microbacterium sp.]|uniref:DedA family protein n=1 Tax=Microbacterium sp. TaxID=51671 RepID=UPI001AC7FA06|nr:VTT domain-containing protein [Microbacterium sp.]MBN9154900.1 VTT domain-containing protein [Microbacterium sp.]
MALLTSLSGFGLVALVIVALLVFVENGLLFPFLPGDSLVFAAAVIAAAIGVNGVLVAAIAAFAALAGGELGFLLGRRYGRRLFRPGATVLKEKYLEDTERFFARWGSLALVLARFVPIVRTYVAPAAGMTTMAHRAFSLWNAVSAVLWAAALGGAGALLGSIPWVADNIEWIMIGIILLTVVPIVVAVLAKRNRVKPEGAPRA